MRAYAGTPEGREADARHALFALRDELRGTLEALLLVAKRHDQGARLPWREREHTRDAQQRGILALAKLDDVERRLAGTLAAPAAAHSRSGG